MTDKEKMRELENWLKMQETKAVERWKAADESGNSVGAFAEETIGFVLIQVLYKIEEIERS